MVVDHDEHLCWWVATVGVSLISFFTDLSDIFNLQHYSYHISTFVFLEYYLSNHSINPDLDLQQIYIELYTISLCVSICVRDK